MQQTAEAVVKDGVKKITATALITGHWLPLILKPEKFWQ